jgi:hypothetical protein
MKYVFKMEKKHCYPSCLFSILKLFKIESERRTL